MVSGLSTLNPSSYNSMISGGVGSGKVYVPVKASQVVYSQFEHVSGYATHKNPDSGVSVSKIKILNTLIDQLVKIKHDTVKPELPTELTDKQVDAIIKDYQTQIKTAMNTAKANPFALTGSAAIGTGLVVNAMF